MADYDGEGISDVVLSYTSNFVWVAIAGGYVLPTLGNTNASGSIFHQALTGWYSQSDSLIVITNHYHKRGWRTESSAYVEWETTDRNTPYPGGGTVDPAVGTVVYQWVTYSNGQQPS